MTLDSRLSAGAVTFGTHLPGCGDAVGVQSAVFPDGLLGDGVHQWALDAVMCLVSVPAGRRTERAEVTSHGLGPEIHQTQASQQ